MSTNGVTAPTAPIIDVLVVGAGPTGLTLACDLARRGASVRIIERRDRPSHASRGKGLQPRSLEILDDLGVADDILTRGAVRMPVRMIAADGTVTDRDPITSPVPDGVTPYPELLWIAQFDVEAPLRDRLAHDGVFVEFGVEAVGIRHDDDGVSVETTGREPAVIRARWVVAADGGKSTVRHLLAIPFDGFTMDDRWYLGDLRLTGLDHSVQHILPTRHGMIGLTPLPTTDLWQWQSTIDAGSGLEQPSPALFQRLLDEHLGAGKVTVDDASWLSLYRANVRLASRFRDGRVLLAGDAAHAHSPAGGQGMNTGIQDAWNLSWKLDAVLHGAHEGLVDTYERERRPIAAAVLEGSTRKMRKFVDNAAGGRTGVNDGLEGMGEDATGLGLRYPDTPVSLERTPAVRAPYATGLRGAGFAGTTFDLMRGPGWTLLLFSDSDADLACFGGLADAVRVHRIGPGAIVDAQGAAAERFGAEQGSVVLIRPDGYIAAHVHIAAAHRVIDHLSTVISAPLRDSRAVASAATIQVA